MDCNLKKFCGVPIDNLPIVEDIEEKNIFTYDIDIGNEYFIRKLFLRNIGEYEKTVKLLGYINLNFYVSNIDIFFNCFRCPTCDTFFHKADN